MEAWADPEHDIRAAGLRCTAQRVAVLGALRTERAHLRVDDVAERVRERIGTISHQAVYDALGALVGAGLARRIEPAGSPAMYEARAGDNHHHLVCRRCGTTVDTDCVHGAAPCLEPASTHGFAVDEAEVTFWGVCPACQPGAAHSPSR
jgi:Fur family ferric uptake transcriptional regulator